MTLATIFLLFPFLASSPALPTSAITTEIQPPQQSSSSEAPATAQAPSNSQAATPAPKTPGSGSKKATAPHRHRSNKKSAGSPCLVSPKSTKSASEVSTSSSPQNAGHASAASTAGKDCPPPKIVVRQGGTDEPSIQLAGGPTAQQAAQQRDAINQMLGSAEENLKKTADMPLSPSQRDTVSQTRQFMQQSKAAMADGEWERAHTLAWKAQLLSEDLVSPQK